MRYSSAANSAASSPPVPGADLDDGIAVVERIGRHEQGLDLLLESPGLPPRGEAASRLRLRPHLRVILRNELAHLRELVFQPGQPVGARDDTRQPLMFTTQLGQPLGVAMDARVKQLAFNVGRATERVGEALAQAQTAAFRLNFWLKRSTRPAVSTSFCLPVKNGWQLEQTSRWIESRTERVWNVFPHAQMTVVVAYTGWISAFTGNLWACVL